MSVEHSLFMRAARRQPVERTPVWFMRQAGRVLPEYRAIREALSLLEITKRPDVCAEVTLQPVRRFNVDAAILFADIMHPLIGAGVDLDIVDGVGPVIAHPIRTASDVHQLRPLVPADDLPYVLETVRILRRELGDRLPLIGFAGAPFTLAAYLIEGRGTREFTRTKALMYGDPRLWHLLMDRLTSIVIVYLHALRSAGTDALQLFDSWIGCLSSRDYVAYVQPYCRRIFAELAPLGAPLIHFGVNTATLLPEMAHDGGTVIGVDWRIGLDDAWRIIGADTAIQGNLDPAALLAPDEVIDREVRDILVRAADRPGHIFNLGHGVLPETRLEAVCRVVEVIHEYARQHGAPAEPNELLTAGGW
jgi:uroporphyrinogen decarboxylase